MLTTCLLLANTNFLFLHCKFTFIFYNANHSTLCLNSCSLLQYHRMTTGLIIHNTKLLMNHPQIIITHTYIHTYTHTHTLNSFIKLTTTLWAQHWLFLLPSMLWSSRTSSVLFINLTWLMLITSHQLHSWNSVIHLFITIKLNFIAAYNYIPRAQNKYISIMLLSPKQTKKKNWINKQSRSTTKGKHVSLSHVTILMLAMDFILLVDAILLFLFLIFNMLIVKLNNTQASVELTPLHLNIIQTHVLTKMKKQIS